MRQILMLAADYANITGDGKLNVMGVFNDINAARFPARHPSMHLVAKLGVELGEWDQARQFTVKLLDPDGAAVMEMSGEFRTPTGQGGRQPEVNIILELKDLVFPTPGPYRFVLLVDRDHKGDVGLFANQIEGPVSPKPE